jgi:cytidine deaminase
MADEKIEQLISAARAAAKGAYAPYSHFPVGAALLDSAGRVFTGCNVENASYGLGICAERNAVFAMVGAGGRDIVQLVVYVPGSKPTRPCGACRQVIFEFGRECQIICVCDGADRFVSTLAEIYPQPFGPDELT